MYKTLIILEYWVEGIIGNELTTRTHKEEYPDIFLIGLTPQLQTIINNVELQKLSSEFSIVLDEGINTYTSFHNNSVELILFYDESSFEPRLRSLVPSF